MHFVMFGRDVRLAVRTLQSSRGFAATVVLTLALAIGAVTAMFSVVDGVVLKPLAVHDQDNLLVVWKSVPARGFDHMPFTYVSYEGMRERLPRGIGLAAHAYHGTSRAALHMDGRSVPLEIAGVTGGWFDVLGARPRAGRMLESADDRIGAPPVLVLASGAADLLFGGAAFALGRTLHVNEQTYTVVGVAPSGFEYPRGAEAWAPASALFLVGIEQPTSLRDADKVAWDLLVRAGPGSAIERTRAELTAALAALDTEPVWLGEQRIRAERLEDVITGDVRAPLFALVGAVLLVLLVAGVNVANLLLARDLTRSRELAVRAAIGASRGHILRQLATETVVLVAAGAVLGVIVARFALQGLLALAPAEIPRVQSIGIDARALIFTIGIAGVAALALGTLPALRTSRLAASGLLRTRDGAEPGSRAYRLRHGLVVAQIAITALVLSTAGLLLRSLERLQRLDPGFSATEVVLAEIAMPPSHYPIEADHQRAMVRLAEQAATLPGVTSATAITTRPFAGTGGVDAVWYAEGQSLPYESNPYSNYEGVDARHFATLDMPILRGRGIETGDRAGSRAVVVINEAFARLHWPGSDPVGRRIKAGTPESTAEWRTIVGIVGDTRYRELTRARPTVYVPYEQGIPVRPHYIALRAGRPDALGNPLRRMIAEAEPGAAVIGLAAVPSLLDAPLARPRFQSVIAAAFAALGLALSIIGTYGVLAFFVRQRTREIGIRMALGADEPSVRWWILRHGLGMAAAGTVTGTAGAALAGQLIESMLFDVQATDPIVVSGTAALLLAAAAAAALLPAAHAIRVPPLHALRQE